jgi:hypothetical protein
VQLSGQHLLEKYVPLATRVKSLLAPNRGAETQAW